MEVSVTRRIIGAIVLIALSAFILPQIFDGSGRIPDRPEMVIPPVVKKPDATRLTVDNPPEIKEAAARPLPAADDVVIEEAPKPVDQSPASTESAASLVADGVWSLQVASFKDSKNAARLRDGLREKGLRAYNKETRLSDGSILTQVLVGPVSDYDKAQEMKSGISTEAAGLGISGPPLVVKYSP